MENEILSLDEVAKLMCVSKRRIQQFAEDGLIRRVARGQYVITQFYADGSEVDGMNLPEFETSIKHDLERQLEENRTVKKLSAHLAVEMLIWMKKRNFELRKVD